MNRIGIGLAVSLGLALAAACGGSSSSNGAGKGDGGTGGSSGGNQSGDDSGSSSGSTPIEGGTLCGTLTCTAAQVCCYEMGSAILPTATCVDSDTCPDGGAEVEVMCMTAADCTSPEVCCVSAGGGGGTGLGGFSFTSSCMSQCGASDYQLCSASAPCPDGDVCGVLKVCEPADAGEFTFDGGYHPPDGGHVPPFDAAASSSSSGGTTPSDAASSDAPSE